MGGLDNTTAPAGADTVTADSTLDGGIWRFSKVSTQLGDRMVDLYHACLSLPHNARVHMESHHDWDKLVEACKAWEKHAEQIIPSEFR